MIAHTRGQGWDKLLVIASGDEYDRGDPPFGNARGDSVSRKGRLGRFDVFSDLSKAPPLVHTSQYHLRDDPSKPPFIGSKIHDVINPGSAEVFIEHL